MNGSIWFVNLWIHNAKRGRTLFYFLKFIFIFISCLIYEAMKKKKKLRLLRNKIEEGAETGRAWRKGKEKKNTFSSSLSFRAQCFACSSAVKEGEGKGKTAGRPKIILTNSSKRESLERRFNKKLGCLACCYSFSVFVYPKRIPPFCILFFFAAGISNQRPRGVA